MTEVAQSLRDKTAVCGAGLLLGDYPHVRRQQRRPRADRDGVPQARAVEPERFGFCGPGEAGEFVKNGRIEIGGEPPINTSGGLLSEGHVIGWNLFIEAVRQLRHECGERQVKDAGIVQYGSFLGESVICR